MGPAWLAKVEIADIEEDLRKLTARREELDREREEVERDIDLAMRAAERKRQQNGLPPPAENDLRLTESPRPEDAPARRRSPTPGLAKAVVAFLDASPEKVFAGEDVVDALSDRYGRDSIHSALSRLAGGGTIRRIERGQYQSARSASVQAGAE